MKFNTKTRYGLRTVIELALSNDEDGILQKEIAERQDISVKYLDHIMSHLKTAGLIRHVKGKKSGYCLTKDPCEISILDVFTAFEYPFSVIDCLESGDHCGRERYCAARDFWNGLNRLMKEYLAGLTVKDLAEKQKELLTSGAMYYI